MTPDLIEKIARAISYRDIGLDWDDCAEEWKDIYRDRATAALAVALDEIGEEVHQIIAKQIEAFASPEYATGQPLSSFQERFACKQIDEAIRARIAEMKRAIKS